MELPIEFENRMKQLLGDGYEAFRKSLDAPPVRSLRVNTLKMSAAQFEKCADFPYVRIPHIDGGYFFECEHIGSHPLHHCGAIYVQEPSAMSVIGGVDIEPDSRILDMCAAPGGKSSQTAAKLSENGIIVSNEIVPSRTRILLQNTERLGLKNSVITSLNTAELAAFYGEYFDLTIVDAPCSGEGMMRKSNDAVSMWSQENIALCALRQSEILDNAAKTVRCGGKLVYSTCTYAPEENELQVDAFLRRHPEFELIPAVGKIADASENGIVFPGCECTTLGLCRRFYPHVSGGEGQFFAVMRKNAGEEIRRTAERTESISAKQKLASDKKKTASNDIDTVRSFISECFADCKKADGLRIEEYKDGFYIVPDIPLPERGVFSPGVKIGTVQKGRVVPHHRFFSAYGDMFAKKIEIGDKPELVEKYLCGETFPCECVGYAAVTFYGAVVGGAKCADGSAKNYYPKGLRTRR